MKKSLLMLAPIIFVTSACTSHYSAEVGHHRGYGHHHNNVSVGVHGSSRGGANVLGALIVGGVIGHILTEEAHQDEQHNQQQTHQNNSQLKSSEDELVNGYPLASKQQQNQLQAEKNNEQNRYYQLGQDGHCYLMEKDNEKIQIVSLVPNYSCK